MKVTRSVIAIAATMVVASPMPALSTKNGPVLGNIDSVQEMSPQVILPYLAHCAGVADSMAPAGSNCLLEAYITQQFPDPTWGDMCSPPVVSLEEINSNLQVAAIQCSDFTNLSYLETASESLMKVFSMDSCWAELCEQDDVVQQLEADYIETCADVDLPYPNDDESMLLSNDEQQNALLTCMLKYVMETPASTFGFDGPASSCYPPGYLEMTDDVCHEFLAVQAFEQCIDLVLSSMMWDDLFMMSMSFDYDMSMKMELEGDDSVDEYSQALDRFCEILEALSTERGRKCLDEICDYEMEMDPEPSSVPTAAPTPMPSPAPSTAPTAEPSEVPSEPPTPYLRPPSMAPSTAPSVMPTADDTDVITNPEVVSAAPLVSTVNILGVSSVLFLVIL